MLADQTLTQLPFFPYGDCRLAGYTLPPKPDSLCASCWEGPFGAHAPWLFDVADGSQLPPGSSSKSYSYWTSEGDIKCRAGMGCAWCRVVESEVSSRYDHSEAGLVNIDVEVGPHFDNGAPPTGMHMITLRLYGRRWGRRYAYTLDEDHPSAPYTKVHAPIIDVGSTESLALARGTLQSCENEHERCRNIIISREEAVLPTRLIDCTDPDRPRLVKSSEGQHSQYVTLSYVWGGDQPHKTTRSNLSQYERGLDLALLPQTIRDAIRTTHELGFNFLWIDSLCIVQDSEDEKQLEIGRMQHIYRYASLTVVAASAQSAADGFLYDRQPSSLRGGISLPILSSPTQTMAEPQIHTLTLFSEYGLPSGVEYRREPISKRAWCLQEHLMSPCSLLFTSKTLQFRCQTATHSIGTSFYNWTSEDRLPDALFLQTPFSSKHDTSDWHTIHNVWNNIVLEYTRRSMTDPSDKLVACAAIAEAFHRVLDSDYLAGLWRHSLLTDLVWYVRGTQPRPAAYRAPSWSWAAVDDELEMINFSHETAFAEVVRCDVSLKEVSIPFGEVTGGSLVLRAQLLRLQLTERDAGELQFDPGEQSLRNHRVDDEDDTATYSIRGHDTSWMAWYDFAIDSADDPDEPSWAIPLGCTYTHMLDGLIVARAQPAASGPNSADSKTLYRRIGCFKSLRCKDSTEHERLLVRPYKNKEVPLQEIEII